MNDANGHALAIGDIVHPDNIDAASMTLRIDSFDGTYAGCRYQNALAGPAMIFLPNHLIWISTPA